MHRLPYYNIENLMKKFSILSKVFYEKAIEDENLKIKDIEGLHQKANEKIHKINSFIKYLVLEGALNEFFLSNLNIKNLINAENKNTIFIYPDIFNLPYEKLNKDIDEIIEHLSSSEPPKMYLKDYWYYYYGYKLLNELIKSNIIVLEFLNVKKKIEVNLNDK